jgi:hypothetical protein
MEGYVYLIGSPTFGWYKIGKSKTPEVRVNNIGVLLPFKICVIGVWKAKNHSLLETSLHEIYASKKINGEWFEFSKKGVYEVFDRIPDEAKVYPSDSIEQSFDRFSNIVEDTKGENKVIGLRVQKLRGDFTSEERAARRDACIEERRKSREAESLADK